MFSAQACRGVLGKKTVLENLDLVLITIDETVDDGYDLVVSMTSLLLCTDSSQPCSAESASQLMYAASLQLDQMQIGICSRVTHKCVLCHQVYIALCNVCVVYEVERLPCQNTRAKSSCKRAPMTVVIK
jgi:hypothetical protein